MAKTTVKELKAVDDEYREAAKEFAEAKARFEAASEARTSAHRLYELGKGHLAQTIAGLSDDEWVALRQAVTTNGAIDVNASAHDPSA